MSKSLTLPRFSRSLRRPTPQADYVDALTKAAYALEDAMPALRFSGPHRSDFGALLYPQAKAEHDRRVAKIDKVIRELRTLQFAAERLPGDDLPPDHLPGTVVICVDSDHDIALPEVAHGS